MTDGPLSALRGGDSGIVEINEAFGGGKVANNMHRNETAAAAGGKTVVKSLVDRDGDTVG